VPTVVAISAGVLLVVSALFSALTWPALFRRVARDPRARDEGGRPTPFYTVHRTLTCVALTLAALCLTAGVLVFVFIGA
jgi:hypothetical protein